MRRKLWGKMLSIFWGIFRDVEKLRHMIYVGRCSCAVVELERGMRVVFGRLENRFLMAKLRGFERIKKAAHRKVV